MICIDIACQEVFGHLRPRTALYNVVSPLSPPYIALSVKLRLIQKASLLLIVPLSTGTRHKTIVVWCYDGRSACLYFIERTFMQQMYVSFNMFMFMLNYFQKTTINCFILLYFQILEKLTYTNLH